MHPGQRIKLIKIIAESLIKNYDGIDIDLILRQFDIRTSDSWDGNQKSYVIGMVEYADDNKLVELNNFLIEEGEEKGNGSENILTKSVSKCWDEGILHLFISHSSKDKKEVTELKAAFRKFKISAFVAHEDIQPTEEWQEEILCGLNTCDALVAWSTAMFETSAFAQQEIGIAIAKRKIILTVRRGIDPVGFTARQQGVNGKKEIKDIARDIVDILVGKPSLNNAIQESLISSLEHSGCFEDSKEKIGLLEKFNTWTPEQLVRLKNANNNSQVEAAYGVPERIKALVKKYTKESEQIEEAQTDDLPF